MDLLRQSIKNLGVILIAESIMKHLFFLISIVLLVGCNSSGTTDNNDQGVETIKSQNDDTVKDSIQAVEKDTIALITGSCENHREVGEMSQYRYKMKVGTSKSGDISVRSDAACFEIGACKHNIIGKIKSGTIIYCQGPLKNRGGSAGVAYAFPVKDKDGNMCRGYLSYLNVENMSSKQYGNLPDGEN